MPADCIVVIPAYNEQESIRGVCLEWLGVVKGLAGARVVVVNDGSTDGTGEILLELARQAPALVVVNQANSGHGRAVRRGYRTALEMGCEWLFQVDSDGQFCAADFEKLWACRARSDFILGRRAGRKDPRHRRWLSAVHRLLVLALYGVWIRDPNIPFRLMRASLLAALLEVVPETVFAPNVLLAILAAASGQPLCHVPVEHLARTTGTGSIRARKLAPLLLRCLKELAVFRWGCRGRLRTALSSKG